jgi:hypothetical protein
MCGRSRASTERSCAKEVVACDTPDALRYPAFEILSSHAHCLEAKLPKGFKTHVLILELVCAHVIWDAMIFFFSEAKTVSHCCVREDA